MIFVIQATRVADLNLGGHSYEPCVIRIDTDKHTLTVEGMFGGTYRLVPVEKEGDRDEVTA